LIEEMVSDVFDGANGVEDMEAETDAEVDKAGRCNFKRIATISLRAWVQRLNLSV
jgi:hypothetical protein